jgi:RNA polymerase sporulation-specific sigma factor
VLVARYRRFARARSRPYFIVGGDRDDLEQEALIGLYKAARDFRPEHLASFRAFAELCITRQIITAIKAANRQKHQPLNQYVSTSAGPVDVEQRDRTVDELLGGDPGADPAERIVAAERIAGLRAVVARLLSPLEVDVLRLYAEGRTYEEIGALLGRHVKAIDNAIQRVKRKLDEYLRNERIPEAAEPVALAS